MLCDYLMTKYTQGRYHAEKSIFNENMLIEDLRELAFTVLKLRDFAAVQLMGYCEHELKIFFETLEKSKHFDDGYEIRDRVYHYTLYLSRMMGEKSISHNGEMLIIDDELAVHIKESFNLLQDPYSRSLRLIAENDGYDYSNLHAIYLDPSKGHLTDSDMIMPYILGAELQHGERFGFMQEKQYPVHFKTHPIIAALHKMNAYTGELTMKRVTLDRELCKNMSDLDVALMNIASDAFNLINLFSQIPSDVESLYRSLCSELSLQNPPSHYLSKSTKERLDNINYLADISDIKKYLSIIFDEPEVVLNEESSAEDYFEEIYNSAAIYTAAMLRIADIAKNKKQSNDASNAALGIFALFSSKSKSYLNAFPLVDVASLSELMLLDSTDLPKESKLQAIFCSCPLTLITHAIKNKSISTNDVLEAFIKFHGRFFGQVYANPEFCVAGVSELLLACETVHPGFMKGIDLRSTLPGKDGFEDCVMTTVLLKLNEDKVHHNEQVRNVSEDDVSMDFLQPQMI